MSRRADLVTGAAPGIGYHHLPTDDHGGEINASWSIDGIREAQRAVDVGGSALLR